MGMESLIIVVNPGSSSRKYSLYAAEKCLIDAYYETENERITLILTDDSSVHRYNPEIIELDDALEHFVEVLMQKQIIRGNSNIAGVGIRVVAPSSYFLEDHRVDEQSLAALRQQRDRAPLHIDTVLREVEHITTKLPGHPIFMISDSSFHKTKSDVAWNYALPLDIADKYDLKRYGYHGLSIASVVRRLESAGLLLKKTIVCHLGSGASITALNDGASVDTSMGYSPLEGLIMATRSGTVDAAVVFELQKITQKNSSELEEYLNTECGLLGLSGRSSDIRDLLQSEQDGDYRSGLALRSYADSVRKHIAAMSTVLGGIDTLIFTGTVGERSSIMRTRILENLEYFGIVLDAERNNATQAEKPLVISRAEVSIPVIVMHADEGSEIALRVKDNLAALGGM